MHSSPDASELEVPLCFASEEQYRAWKKLCERADPGPSDFCADCTVEFQSERIRDRRCSFPGTTFQASADGFVDGVRPGCELPRRRPSKKRRKATP